MNFLFICKASTEIGLGHLIRSRSLAEVACKGHKVQLIVIGSKVVKKLLSEVPFDYHIISTENDIPEYLKKQYDVIVFDMMNLNERWVSYLKKKASLCVSISPIFNHMDKMDILFSRTRYNSKDYASIHIKQYLGLEYAIIPKSCIRINSKFFWHNLNNRIFPIAISMGGGDAANKTLLFLQSLKKCDVPATFWVLVGEGYNHSYGELIRTIEKDQNHEIILAKTNMSMWHILNNCVLAILPGGVTTYEAAYAGLPTINMFESADQFFLIQELVESGVSINAGLINKINFNKLNDRVENLYSNRDKLFEMHNKSKNLIDGHGSDRILKTIEEKLKSGS